MKKLITKFSNLPLILIAFLFLLVVSCDDDDDPYEEPKDPNPDSSIDSKDTPLLTTLENSKSIYFLG